MVVFVVYVVTNTLVVVTGTYRVVHLVVDLMIVVGTIVLINLVVVSVFHFVVVVVLQL